MKYPTEWLRPKPTKYDKVKIKIEQNELKNQQIKELSENICQLKDVSGQMHDQAAEFVRDGMPKEMVMMVLNVASTLKTISGYMGIWRGLVTAGFGIQQTASMLNDSKNSVPMLIGTGNIADITTRVGEFSERISSFVEQLDASLKNTANSKQTKQSEDAYQALLAKHGATRDASNVQYKIENMSTVNSVLQNDEAVYNV